MTTITRRGFLAGTAATCAAGVAAPLLRPQLAFASDGIAAHTLVLVVLDGGLDGLSALVPAGDAGYDDARRRTHVPGEGAIAVDPSFALHPSLAPIAELWDDGLVAAVPATGNPTSTRSHGAEMAVMAEGLGGGTGDGSGWVARHLLTRAGGVPVTLQGMSFGQLPTATLRGHDGAFHVPDLAEAGLDAWAEAQRPTVEQALAEAYARSVPALASSAATAFDALDRLRSSGATTGPGADGYDANTWAAQLRQVGQLIRADVGMEAAVVTFPGWDTHRSQGGREGRLAILLDRLARALASFAADVHGHLDDITVVVVSEFGRRVTENASGGTDHGKGGLALVLGDGVHGGVHGAWPGLDGDSLDGGDVAVATDVRSVLAEVVHRRLGNPAIDQVFPGFTPVPVGVA